MGTKDGDRHHRREAVGGLFDAASGHLYAETEAESPPGSKNLVKVATKGTTKGQLKVEGYQGVPLPLVTLGKP